VEERDKLLAHLELCARTLAAQAALAQLDDSRTDELLPDIRASVQALDEVLDALGAPPM
jgi:hypothetical protein